VLTTACQDKTRNGLYFVHVLFYSYAYHITLHIRFKKPLAKRCQNRYRIPSSRLPGHDYGAPGGYFVTICTKGRRWFFGDVVGGKVHHSA